MLRRRRMPATRGSAAPGRERGAGTEPPSALPGTFTEAAADAAQQSDGAPGGELGGSSSGTSSYRVPARDAGGGASGVISGGPGEDASGGPGRGASRGPAESQPGKMGLAESGAHCAPASTGRPRNGAAEALEAYPASAGGSEEAPEAPPSGSAEETGQEGGASGGAAGASPALRGGLERADGGAEASGGAAGGGSAGAEELDLTCAHLHTLEGVALPQSLTARPCGDPHIPLLLPGARPGGRCRVTRKPAGSAVKALVLDPHAVA